ncbi:alpha/beta fold hydrolase [Marinobacter zhejiangensis]|uniref:Esterase/lipase n=1 Tax=Marinobacter zhejiangensis TaxID=488535 RepID=A0A1I4LCJ6_9GAMM|nr:alpha/beta fold hydrolase [Marinobacter zhejiangensis]SFL88589.1 Esterase/lipase [Marinobacter zhejiangensis]
MTIGMRAFQWAFSTYSQALPTLAAGTATRLMTKPRVPDQLRKRSVVAGEDVVALAGGGYLSVRPGGARNALLVHGWSSGAGMFEGVAQALSQRGYTLYSVHPAGHGPSTEPSSHPGRFIEAIEAALAYIDGPVDLAVGHSMGAGTLAYVVAGTERIHRLALVSGPATFEGLLRRFARLMRMSSRAEQRFLSQMERTVGLPLSALDITERAKLIHVPTLVIHDRNDREVPFECAGRLAQSLSRSEVFPTDGLGHNRILRDAEVVLRIAEFADGSSIDEPSAGQDPEGRYATASS